MNLSKAPSIILSLVTIGAIQDTYITFTKERSDTATRIISVILTLLFLGLTIYFWLRKNRKHNAN